jgi:hypothetical protein
MRSKTILTFLLPFALTVPLPSFATVDDNAEVILVRKDCSALDNCFETIAEALSWTWGTRHPSATNPLLWDVGPGIWNEPWSCQNNGYVTVRGAGREQTIIQFDSLVGAVSGINCEQLEFIDIGFRGSNFTVYWRGTGSSTWTNVDIIATEGGTESIAWADEYCPQAGQEERAVHYFFGSRIVLQDVTKGGYPAVAWYGHCSEAWFYGGELVIDWSENATALPELVDLGENARFQAFGTALRGVVSDTATAGGVMIGVTMAGVAGKPTSMFHMHGGIISLLTNPSQSVAVVGLYVSGNALAHTPGTAFNLRAGSGSLTYRALTSGGGKVDSPFMWQAATTPPAASTEANVLISENGEDMFVETDCAANGDCDSGGNQAHLMIYNPAECGTTEPWFNVVTGRCRDDTGP